MSESTDPLGTGGDFSYESLFRGAVSAEKRGFDQCRERLTLFVRERIGVWNEALYDFLAGQDAGRAQGRIAAYEDVLNYLKGSDST
jgi:hypothetical protein